jgi:hypothetical protein
MRQVGKRRERHIAQIAAGQLLAEGALFSESIAALAKTTFIRKGVYRFGSHNEANQHAQDCLAQGMGLLAAERL